MPNFTHNRNALFIVALFFFCGYLFPLHSYPYRTFFNELLTVSGAFIGLFYLLFSTQGSIRFTSALMLPLGLAIIIGLQAFNGFLVFPIDALFPILTLIGFSVALTLGATLAKAELGLTELSVALSWTFIASCLLSLVCQHIQIANLNFSPWVLSVTSHGFLRPFANIGQPNLLALLFCFSVASVWYLYVMEKIRPMMSLAIVLLMFWGSALTQSRILWIIFPLFVFSFWTQPDGSRKLPKAVLIGLVLCFALMVLFAPVFLQLVGVSADSLAHRAGQNSIRLTLWNQAWMFSLMHPWLGAGWFQFGAEQVRYAQFFNLVEYADHSHNIVLNFADEIGWPFTIVLFASAAYWFYVSCFKRWNQIPVRFLSALLIAAMVHSMVEYPLWYAMFSIPFALIVGALHDERLGFKDFLIFRSISGAAALVFILTATFLCVDTIHAVQAFKALDDEQIQQGGEVPFSKPSFTLYPQFYDFLHIQTLKIEPATAKENIPQFEKLALRFGFPPVLESLAFLYAWDNRPQAAAGMLTRIQRLNGYASTSYLEIYDVWANLALQDPVYFGQIVKQIPIPVSLATPKATLPTK